MIGQGMVKNIWEGRWPRSMNSRSEMSSMRRPSWSVSRPDENDLPSPRQTMARSSGMLVHLGQHLEQPPVHLVAHGVVLPGRLLVITAMGPSTSRRTRSLVLGAQGAHGLAPSVDPVPVGCPPTRAVSPKGGRSELLADRGERGLDGVAPLPVGPVHHQRVAADVGGVGGAEVGGGPGQLAGEAHPAGRDPSSPGPRTCRARRRWPPPRPRGA